MTTQLDTARKEPVTTATQNRPATEPVTFLELEITRDCTLRCSHCYSNSGPTAGNGTMTTADWTAVIKEAAEHPTIDTVQFIGGEPTRHSSFANLAFYALLLDLNVAVFTNLVSVTEQQWRLFTKPRVQVSTSWYSTDPAQHDTITGQPGSFDLTWSNIYAARRLGIELKVGIVKVLDDQDIDGAERMLAELGITDITRDHARPVGRAAHRRPATSKDLCGRCGRGRAAIDTTGRLMPCVLGRHHSIGNVREAPLAELLDRPEWADLVSSIHGTGRCAPADSNDCNPAL